MHMSSRLSVRLLAPVLAVLLAWPATAVPAFAAGCQPGTLGSSSLGTLMLGCNNAAPSNPVLVSPAHNTVVGASSVAVVATYSDPQTDAGTVQFRASTTSAGACTTGTGIAATAESSSTASGANATATLTGLADGTYYWCARSSDGVSQSAWVSMATVIVDAVTPPTGGSVSYPAGAQSGSTSITVTVNRGSDLMGMSTNAADYLLEYRTATSTSGTCGTYGSWADAGVTEAPAATSYSFSGADGQCYQFRYTVKDTTGNAATYTASAETSLDESENIALSYRVIEALVFQIDRTSINFSVDPSVGGGRTITQRNVLTVSTNAENGYQIQAQLQDSGGNAAVRRSGSSDVISSGAFNATENRFGYIALPGDTTQLQSTLAGYTSYGFANTPATLSIYSGGTASSNAPVSQQQYTVYYGANVDYTTPGGQYSGTVTYTAVPSF